MRDGLSVFAPWLVKGKLRLLQEQNRSDSLANAANHRLANDGAGLAHCWMDSFISCRKQCSNPGKTGRGLLSRPSADFSSHFQRIRDNPGITVERIGGILREEQRRLKRSTSGTHVNDVDVMDRNNHVQPSLILTRN